LFRISVICFFVLLLLFCSVNTSLHENEQLKQREHILNWHDNEKYYSIYSSEALVYKTLSGLQFPQNISANILNNQDFIKELHLILEGDPYLWLLVDKKNSLPADYIPSDLVRLRNSSYEITVQNMTLRRIAITGLEEMSVSAKNEGVQLFVTSAYRSYSHQSQIFEHYVNLHGFDKAVLISARPGTSQHQLGLTIDFESADNFEKHQQGIINDDNHADYFFETPEGKWLSDNASRFGWSISYPKDYEEITGYSWESWHYRYVGKPLALFIDTYFEGVQQYALEFIDYYTKQISNIKM